MEINKIGRIVLPLILLVAVIILGYFWYNSMLTTAFPSLPKIPNPF